MTEQWYVGDRAICTAIGGWTLYTEEGSHEVDDGPECGEVVTVRRLDYCPLLGELVAWFEEYPGDTFDEAFTISGFDPFHVDSDSPHYRAGYQAGFAAGSCKCP